ncbi:LysM peptidoglycan-binding domain-containing protein [Agriterribacter sp.]|uniref:LysM peptidoglycan-binding domain-containing protein n=1 Tax=Agriterribacter sp. TaxID=2821509 RepID=UPI002C5C1D94|nr:LysM peptidoglycan-binding domain-containing protein [Agriterribacter sp.]HTN07549.1 LysM peptidoglycan-binding domain-containing protein [Agriterribacter sp.]
MKKLVIIWLSFGIAFVLKAQPADLIIQSEHGKLFLHHMVGAKENFYSIGRLYNISPKEIAPFNGLSLSSGLEIDQQLRIPLLASNFTQHGAAAADADEVFVPLYHVVAQKEGLYRIGQNFNKVSVNDLKTWNNLSSETISNGQALVVGFLRVKTNLSALAVRGIKRIGGSVAGTPAAAPPVVTQPESRAVTTTRPVEEPVVKTVETVQNTAVQNNAEGTGFFKSSYREQAGSFSAFKSERGEAAVFKSTSGWQDAKYYALMNNIIPGTIVRITNTGNSRIIFAKVLGELPPGKENEGLLIRISNAAAAELKVTDKELKFSAEVAYAKEGR